MLRSISGIGILLALGCGACAGLGSGLRTVDLSAAEREVLMYIIREHGRGAVLFDSTYGHRCATRPTATCEEPGAPAEAWEAYLRAASERAALRDLLPPDAGMTYASEIGDESRVPCERRRHKLELSRAGVSPDGRTAVVSYTHWIPMDHMGCGAVSGRTVLLRRDSDGAWREDRMLRSVTS